MIKAVVKNGMIVPSEPLPEEWKEGTHVAVEMANDEPLANTSIHPADAWMDAVEAIARQGDPADDLRLDAAIQAILRREKENAVIRYAKRMRLKKLAGKETMQNNWSELETVELDSRLGDKSN